MNQVTVHDEQNRSKGLFGSGILHAILLLLFFLPLWKAPAHEEQPPATVIELEWGGGGDNAALGKPDAGQGNESAPADEPEPEPSPSEPEPTPEPAKPTPAKPAPATPSKSEPTKQTSTTEDPNVAALKKQREEAAKADRERQASEAKAQKEAAAAAAKAEADRLAKKNKYGGGLGGNGPGKGTGGKTGNQGIENGSPDGDNPFGKSPGSGGGTGGGSGTGNGPSVGGGLSGRKVRSPKIFDSTQKTGIIVIAVCVDKDGNVVSADYTQKGSTTSDSELKEKAINAARKSKFETSSQEKQCGTLAYNFQLQ